MRAMNVATALVNASGTVVDNFESRKDQELFHYTDTAGLIGMLQNQGEIWASDVRCMNDSGEFTLGHDLVEQAIRKRIGHPAHGLLTRLMQHPSYVSGVVFVTSFSEDQDLLSQWRAYADNGAGFAIGFNAAELTQLQFDTDPIAYNIVKVSYDEGAQPGYAEQLVDGALGVLKSISEAQLTDQDDQIIVMALGLLVPTFAAACKNAGFVEEREHRIVVRSHQDPLLPNGAKPELTMPVCNFRASKYGITPFVRLRFPKGTLTQAISRIKIGPRNTAPDTEQRLRVLLANAGIKNWSKLPIERAKATYR